MLIESLVWRENDFIIILLEFDFLFTWNQFFSGYFDTSDKVRFSLCIASTVSQATHGLLGRKHEQNWMRIIIIIIIYFMLASFGPIALPRLRCYFILSFNYILYCYICLRVVAKSDLVFFFFFFFHFLVIENIVVHSFSTEYGYAKQQQRACGSETNYKIWIWKRTNESGRGA